MADCEHELVGRAHVIRPRGEFAGPVGEGLLGQALSACLEDRSQCVVVNWAGIARLDSLCLGAVVLGEAAIHKHGGQYRNCCLTREHLLLVSIAKVGGFRWRIVATEEEAVRQCPDLGGATAPEQRSDSSRHP
jgi:anti-anti-sigma regulatory factor